MTVEGLLFPGLVAFAIGAVAARRLPLVGLVVVLGLILGFILTRFVINLPFPNLLETILLIALVQAGYLVSALMPLGDARRARGGTKQSPTARHDNRAS